MAITQTYTRPAATQTASKSGNWAIAVTEDTTNKQFILDLTCVIGANTKLVKRFKVPLSYGGTTLTPTITELTFAGNAANYVSSVSPADAIAIATLLHPATSVDMDAFHTAAGDARV